MPGSQGDGPEIWVPNPFPAGWLHAIGAVLATFVAVGFAFALSYAFVRPPGPVFLVPPVLLAALSIPLYLGRPWARVALGVLDLLALLVLGGISVRLPESRPDLLLLAGLGAVAGGGALLLLRSGGMRRFMEARRGARFPPLRKR